MSEGDAVYVYGVVPRARLPGRLAGRGVRLVTSGGVAALITDVAASPVDATRRNLLAHADILEDAFTWTTVLPMSFGVVLPDESAVRDVLLDANRDLLEELLERHASTAELTVKAFYDEDAVLAELVLSDPELARLRELYRAAPTFERGLTLGEEVAARLEGRRDRDAARVVDVLAPLALDMRAGELMADHAVLSLALLIQRDQAELIEVRLEDARSNFSRSLRFKLVGPLPPYSFVDVQLAVAA